MKRIGIIGGLGPEATIDYYKEIIKMFNKTSVNADAEYPVINYPEIIIYSVNMAKFIGFMGTKEYDKAVEYLGNCIKMLENAGVEIAAISANTPHIFYDSLKERSGIPLISIVEATYNECIKRGLKRIGLFGTGFTMEASFYPDHFKKHNMQVIMPDKKDKETINNKLFHEIELGIFKDETRKLLMDIIDKMVQEEKIDSLILGCTEFPLILTEDYYSGIPMLNTTQIHVEEILRYCLNE